MSYFQDVVSWHLVMDHPVAAEVSLKGTASTNLGWALVEEEMNELKKGWVLGDPVEVADGIADEIWVLCGLAARLGINLDEVWAEVKRANFEKMGGPKRADGKQLKPEGWQPPDIAAALNVPILESAALSLRVASLASSLPADIQRTLLPKLRMAGYAEGIALIREAHWRIRDNADDSDE